MLANPGLAALVAASVLVLACEPAPVGPSIGTRDPTEGSPSSVLNAEPIDPIPLHPEVASAVAELGELLFFSTVVSADGHVSCASCHALDHGMADRSAVSEIPFRPKTATNSTSLFNVRYFYKIKWSGEFDSIDTHLDALIKTPKIMGSNWAEIVARLSAEPAWGPRFHAVFSDGITVDNVRSALLEYERSLVATNAPFDRWLRGDSEALSPLARTGYQLFKDYGCVSCHQGMSVGANMLARFGVMGAKCSAPAASRDKEADLGRFSVTHRPEDRHVFRVPSLRNVATTGPYFHDGSAASLGEAVQLMGECQLGRELSVGDISAIVAFLQSLTGEYRGRSL
jgi:cytochrome c peroxidase